MDRRYVNKYSTEFHQIKPTIIWNPFVSQSLVFQTTQHIFTSQYHYFLQSYYHLAPQVDGKITCCVCTVTTVQPPNLLTTSRSQWLNSVEVYLLFKPDCSPFVGRQICFILAIQGSQDPNSACFSIIPVEGGRW